MDLVNFINGYRLSNNAKIDQYNINAHPNSESSGLMLPRTHYLAVHYRVNSTNVNSMRP